MNIKESIKTIQWIISTAILLSGCFVYLFLDDLRVITTRIIK